MAREIAIAIYLLFFRIVFNLFKLFPLKDKVTFTVSFGDNSRWVIDEIKNQKIPVEVVVLYKGRSCQYFRGHEQVELIPFETLNIKSVFQSIYHLATSRYVFVDNYFGFLAVSNFKKGVQCIQLWHASGAIKKFGLEDEAVKHRSHFAKKRFLSVYKRFDKVVVGSDMMANIFKEAFNLTENNILRTGVPRTDFFYDENLQNKAITHLIQNNPVLKTKQKILYAPTYRESDLAEFQLKLDLEKMNDELGEDCVILLRLHPAVKCKVDYTKLFSGFVYDYSSPEYDINSLLLIANYLITDYSSIPYDFALLRRPIIFFAHDLEEYEKERGLWKSYEELVPGPVVKDTDQIIGLIKNNQFDLAKMEHYARIWNRYSNGHACEKLVGYCFKEDSSAQLKAEAL